MPKALVLVGGYGTRLRPLTLTVPKPIVDFANKPMICHQIEALKEAGCDEVVLAINYRPQVMMDFLKEWEVKLGIKITCSQVGDAAGTARTACTALPEPLRELSHNTSGGGAQPRPVSAGASNGGKGPGGAPEPAHRASLLRNPGGPVLVHCIEEPEPMGTAGPLALAREILDDGSGEPFFVLNSDVICEYPLKEMLAYHKAKGGEATILVTKVDDPSKYGVVLMDGDCKVERFVEKPQTFVGDKINAGIYCLNPSVLSRIEPRPTSIEKEVFPAIAADGGLFALALEGFWMDVGQPKDYLTGLGLHLEAVRRNNPASLAEGTNIKGNVIVHPTAKIGKDCVIGPNVAIGLECVIGDGVRLSNCVLLHRVKVKNFARVSDSIVGWGSSVGSWARVDNKAVVGEDVFIADEVYINGAMVLPHKDIKESVLIEGTIIM